MELRWEGDEPGRGVGDARRVLPGAGELVEMLSAPEWVAEHPEAHLLPHLERACVPGAPLSLDGAEADADGAYVIDLTWHGQPADLRGLRAAVFALIGEVAESATYVRQRREHPAPDVDVGEPGGRVIFEVATGMLSPDTSFATHGHVLVLRVARAS